MLAQFALGLIVGCVGIILQPGGECVRVKGTMDYVFVFHKLQGCTVRCQDRLLATIEKLQCHSEQRFNSVAPDFLNFLGVDGENHSEIIRPHAEAILSVIIETEGASWLSFRPADDGSGVVLVLGGRTANEKSEEQRADVSNFTLVRQDHGV